MLPGNVDPRRPEKVQRYKPPTANTNGQGEDLTPDYMNILGQRATTANAPTEPDKHVVDGGSVGGVGGVIISNVNLVSTSNEQNLQHGEAGEVIPVEDINAGSSTNATNVIPTSPQYGVAIISSNVAIADLPTETVTISTDTVTDTTAKQPQQQQPTSTAASTAPTVTTATNDDGKDLHSTPSRNDRFKVVKIASLEPFKRGRWKCMDYVDEAPPPIAQPSKVTQSAGSIPVQSAGGVYLQTQSLPQQQIQQMLLQSGYTNGTQFFPNVPAQMMPQTQYFYPPGANIQTQTLPQQLVNTTGVPSSMAAQFINAASQPYFAAGVVQNSGFAIPANYQNVQYVPANLIPNQNSAFVPTSQTVQLPANFQQSQTYAGQPTMVNGHAYATQNEPQQQHPPPQQQQVTSTSLPTQPAKNVILNTQVQQPVVTQQPPISQTNLQNQMVQNSTQSQSVPVLQNQQQYQQQPQNFQPVVAPPSQPINSQTQIPQNVQVFDQNQKVVQAQQQIPSSVIFEQQNQVVQSNLDKNQQASNVYTNPQFDINVNSLTVLENAEQTSTENVNESNSGTEVQSENATDDPSKTNPVVNAIDNKIEQAMDLVKSHLMYTVREEVEVLKEKIAELMEKIQQLETENNFLRSQIPKSSIATVIPPATPILSTSATVVQSTNTTTTSTAPPNEQQQ